MQALKADLQALQEASTASTVEVQRLTLQLSDQTSLTSALQSALDEAKAQTAEMQAQLQSTMSVSDKHKDIVSTLEGRLQNLQEDKQRCATCAWLYTDASGQHLCTEASS